MGETGSGAAERPDEAAIRAQHASGDAEGVGADLAAADGGCGCGCGCESSAPAGPVLLQVGMPSAR